MPLGGFSENVQVRVEVQNDHVLLVLPRKLENCIVSWQQAEELGKVLEMAAKDVPDKPLVMDPVLIGRESSQIRINTYHGKYVVLFFEWADRVRLGPEAAKVVGLALRVKAQDCMLLQEKRVRMIYNQHRQPQPHCLPSKKTVFNLKERPS